MHWAIPYFNCTPLWMIIIANLSPRDNKHINLPPPPPRHSSNRFLLPRPPPPPPPPSPDIYLNTPLGQHGLQFPLPQGRFSPIGRHTTPPPSGTNFNYYIPPAPDINFSSHIPPGTKTSYLNSFLPLPQDIFEHPPRTT